MGGECSVKSNFGEDERLLVRNLHKNTGHKSLTLLLQFPADFCRFLESGSQSASKSVSQSVSQSV
jgi:hypothetical protein